MLAIRDAKTVVRDFGVKWLLQELVQRREAVMFKESV